jgi:hypothetical protein
MSSGWRAEAMICAVGYRTWFAGDLLTPPLRNMTAPDISCRMIPP